MEERFLAALAANREKAAKLGVPFAVLLGEDEIAAGLCSVKNMATGQQVTVSPEDAAALILATVKSDKPIILEK